MICIYTSEFVVVSAVLGSSATVIAGSCWILFSQRDTKPKFDVEAAVRNAPYHRLAEIGIIVSPAPKDK